MRTHQENIELIHIYFDILPYPMLKNFKATLYSS